MDIVEFVVDNPNMPVAAKAEVVAIAKAIATVFHLLLS